MTKSQPAISIIIRCYNEERSLGRLLNGIFAQSRRDFEVILVDSGSRDHTLAIADGYPVRVVHIDPAEFSFGRSLNRGCAEARGETLAFISAHCYPVKANWLEELTKPLASPEVALCYGRQQGNEHTRYSEHLIFRRWFPETSTPRQPHPFYNNANAAIRRNLWKSLPFDEELTGLEDLDWAKRALERGYRIAYSAEAVIVHEHQESYSQIFNRYYREAISFHKILPDERFSIWDFTRLFGWNVIKDCQHALLEGVLHRNLLDIPIFRLMQFWGTYRGFHRRDGVGGTLRQRFYYPATSTTQKAQMPESPADGQLIDYNLLDRNPSFRPAELGTQRMMMSLTPRFQPHQN